MRRIEPCRSCPSHQSVGRQPSYRGMAGVYDWWRGTQCVINSERLAVIAVKSRHPGNRSGAEVIRDPLAWSSSSTARFWCRRVLRRWSSFAFPAWIPGLRFAPPGMTKRGGVAA